MMHTKSQFGHDLKRRILAKENVIDIGAWAHSVYVDWPNTDDPFLDFLLQLSTMELGSEFAFTYEELEKIANDLIEGKEVHPTR